MKQSDIKTDLLDQLSRQGKDLSVYSSLVDDYVKIWKIKEDLLRDIKKKGVRFESVNGNGFKTEKFNESIDRIPKLMASLLKILDDLDLKEPVATASEDDYY